MNLVPQLVELKVHSLLGSRGRGNLGSANRTCDTSGKGKTVIRDLRSVLRFVTGRAKDDGHGGRDEAFGFGVGAAAAASFFKIVGVAAAGADAAAGFGAALARRRLTKDTRGEVSIRFNCVATGQLGVADSDEADSSFEATN